jgi:hypothetical protein
MTSVYRSIPHSNTLEFDKLRSGILLTLLDQLDHHLHAGAWLGPILGSALYNRPRSVLEPLLLPQRAHLIFPDHAGSPRHKLISGLNL